MSQAMLWFLNDNSTRGLLFDKMRWNHYRLADLIPPPNTRGPLTLHSFFQDILLPLVCYYVTAVLVILPDTLPIRLALLPLTLWVTFHGATRLDLVLGYEDERLIYLNQGLVLAFTTLGMRVIIWSFQRRPYRRIPVLVGKTKNIEDNAWSADISPKQVVIDAFDLCCNLRGCGWNWSHGLQVPPETRPTISTTAFAVATFISLILHLIFFDITHYSVQWFSPLTVGSSIGGSIFDSRIPPIQRYLRSTAMSFLSGLTIYSAIQSLYHICTLLGVLVFGQHLSLWPPAFKSPWLATSLTEYWAKRWHQMFRDNFISLGARPFSWLIGRVGGVLGAFLISGIFHDFGLWGMGRGSEFQSVGGYFMIMGVGIILEHLWKALTGKRTGGLIGWVWTVTWVVGWSNILIDAWARKGLIGSVFFPEHIRPTTYIFGVLPLNSL